MPNGGTNAGGGGTGGKLIVTAPVGAVATCEKDGRVYTRAIKPDSTATFNGLKTGVWTVTITMEGELPSSQDILITADYAVTLAFFSSLVEVTYPAGSMCTCTDGDIVLTATDTSGHYVFNIQRVGMWAISCTDGSQTAERKVAITATGQSMSITLAYFTATINVTYPAGSDCTCSKGDIVFNAPDTSGSVTFIVPETGEWVVSCNNGLSGDEYEEASETVTITADGQNEYIELSYATFLIHSGKFYVPFSLVQNSGGQGSIENGKIEITADSPANGARTENIIDLTKFSTLTAKGFGAGANLISGILYYATISLTKNPTGWSSTTPGPANGNVASVRIPNNGAYEITLDVSSINEGYYIIAGGWSSKGTTITELYLK